MEIRGGQAGFASGSGDDALRICRRGRRRRPESPLRAGGPANQWNNGWKGPPRKGNMFHFLQRQKAFHGEPAGRAVQRCEGGRMLHGYQRIGAHIQARRGIVPSEQVAGPLRPHLFHPSVPGRAGVDDQWEAEDLPVLQNGFLPPQSVAQDSVYQSSQAYGHGDSRFHTQRRGPPCPAEKLAQPQFENKTRFHVQLAFPEGPMTWSSQVWLRNTLKTKACTDACLPVEAQLVNIPGPRGFPQRSGLHASSSGNSVLSGGGGGLFFTGELYMRNVQVWTFQKSPSRKRGTPGRFRFSPLFSGAAHFLPVNRTEFLPSWSFLVPARFLSSGSLPM